MRPGGQTIDTGEGPQRMKPGSFVHPGDVRVRPESVGSGRQGWAGTARQRACAEHPSEHLRSLFQKRFRRLRRRGTPVVLNE